MQQPIGNNERIHALLVSPDNRLRQRISLLLSNWGLRVTAVETTLEALEPLAHRHRQRRHQPLYGRHRRHRRPAQQRPRPASHITRSQNHDDVDVIWLYGRKGYPMSCANSAHCCRARRPMPSFATSWFRVISGARPRIDKTADDSTPSASIKNTATPPIVPGEHHVWWLKTIRSTCWSRRKCSR